MFLSSQPDVWFQVPAESPSIQAPRPAACHTPTPRKATSNHENHTEVLYSIWSNQSSIQRTVTASITVLRLSESCNLASVCMIWKGYTSPISRLIYNTLTYKLTS
jgi:hypothetical protein